MKWYWGPENVVEVQGQWIRREYRTEPPTQLTIACIRDKFETHGIVCDDHKGRSGRPRTSTNPRPRLWFWKVLSNCCNCKSLRHGCANHAIEGETLQSSIHCCDVTVPPNLFSGELSTSSLHCKRLFVYILSCRRAVSAALCSEHVNQTSY